MIDLGPEYPILLFPIRIETKYAEEAGVKKLRIRFFPDQVSIEGLDPRLTQEEYDDAKAYWEEVGKYVGTSEFETKRNEVWLTLVEEYDCYRASYIVKKVINYDPTTDPDPESPIIRPVSEFEFRSTEDHVSASYNTLPKKFIIYGEYNDSALTPLEHIVTEPTLVAGLKVSPLPIVVKAFEGSIQAPVAPLPPPSDDPYEDLDEELKWMSNFEEAKNKGMAAEIPQTDQEYDSGFKYLIVYGVRDHQTPQETKAMIKKLFNSHHYDHGFSFLKQNTPTNLIDGQNDEFSSADPEPVNWRNDEFTRLEDGSDGKLFEKILGLDFVAQGVQNANIREQIESKNMASALFPAVLGYYFQRFLFHNELPNPIPLATLKSFFENYVSPPGIVFRIGQVPYGVLPTTILNQWIDQELIPRTDYVKTFFGKLQETWLKLAEEVPSVMNPEVDVTPEQNLINILSMDAHSHSYYVRGVRLLQYVYFLVSYFFSYRKPFSELQNLHKEKAAALWNQTFSHSEDQNPTNLESWFYNVVPGDGISELTYPLVGDPKYINELIDNIDEYYRKTEDEHVANYQDTPLLQKLLIFSANFLGTYNIEDNQKQEFIDNLTVLSQLSPEKLELLLLKTLDYTSYRLDSWLTAFAAQRLQQLRSNPANKKGLYLGVFGWIENLKPNEKSPAYEGGYIHGFSHAHASALAIARDGYLNQLSDPEKKDLLKINLNSERTRNALETCQALQNIPLSEFLGMKLERRLHDADLDYVIDEFRTHFPLQTDDIEELSEVVDETRERVVPRNLTNGLQVQEHWKRLKDSLNGISIQNFLRTDETWKPFYDDIQRYFSSNPNLIAKLSSHLNYLLDIVDGLSDLLLLESLYQVVNLKFDHSAAVLDGMSGDGQIPPLESPYIPITGPRITRRIILPIVIDPFTVGTLTVPAADSNPVEMNPKKLAEPHFNNILASYYGDLRFWISEKDEDGTVTNTAEVTLSDLNLEPIDLLFIHEPELRNRLLYYGRNNLTWQNVEINDFKKPSNEGTDKISFSEAQFMINSLKQLVGKGQPLRYGHLVSPQGNDLNYKIFEELFELLVRLLNVVHLLRYVCLELGNAKANDTDLARKRAALLHASFFGVLSSVPLTREETILETAADLNSRINLIEAELSNRLEPIIQELFVKLKAYGITDDIIDDITTFKAILDFFGPKVTDTNTLIDWIHSLVGNASLTPQENEQNRREFASFLLERLLDAFKGIFRNNTFLVLPLFSPFKVMLENLENNNEINKKGHKWMQKNSYVRPRLKLFDRVLDYNEIFETATFSFYYDPQKFSRSSDEILQNEENPVVLLAISSHGSRVASPPSFPPTSDSNKKLAGLVLDDYTEKIVHPEQETVVAFHHNSPNAEPPHCLLLGVSPNDNDNWTKEMVRDVILEALKLAKIRSVDYRSLKGLSNFLSLTTLNSYGDEVYTNLYGLS